MVDASPAGNRLDIKAVNALSPSEFVQAFGGLFEHSPWIAERAAATRPFADVQALLATMGEVLLGAEREAQLALIRAHPELAAKDRRASELTEFSGKEQGGAGLDTCTSDEAAALADLNVRYRDKHGCPCIIAVKGLGKEEILARLDARLAHDPEVEFQENLRQILRIARFRLADLVVE